MSGANKRNRQTPRRRAGAAPRTRTAPRTPARTAPRPAGRSGRPGGPMVVGRHPSPPALLAVIAVAWLAASVYTLVRLHASWKLIPVVVFAGIGLLYLRAAAMSYLRREPPDPPSR